MPASSTTKRRAPGNCFTSTTRVSSTPAGADEHAPGLDGELQSGAARRADDAAHVVGRDRARRRRRRRCRRRRRSPGARSRCRRPAAPRASRTTASAARSSGSSAVICEPMWTWMPTAFSDGREAISLNSAGATSIGTPNLFDLRPVEMCGWLWASMSGLTRRATRATAPRSAARRASRSSSPGDSTLMASRSSATARSSSPGALAHPGEDDVGRGEAAAQRDVHFAHGVGVGGAAERAHQPHDGQRRVRLHRVVDGVRRVAERGVQLPVGGPDGVGAVDVGRGADAWRQSVRGWRRRPATRPGLPAWGEGRSSTRDHSAKARPGAPGFRGILAPPAGAPIALSSAPHVRSFSGSHRRHRHADSAVPCRRSAGLGADRPPAPAEGLQHRLQVHRQARRGRGPDAGHLPQDLQVAAHVRPARQLPDLAGQRVAATCASTTTAASARSARRSIATWTPAS